MPPNGCVQRLSKAVRWNTAVTPLLRRSKTHTDSISTGEAVMVLRRCGRETVSYGDFDQLLDIRLIGSDFAIDFREHAGGSES